MVSVLEILRPLEFPHMPVPANGLLPLAPIPRPMLPIDPGLLPVATAPMPVMVPDEVVPLGNTFNLPWL